MNAPLGFRGIVDEPHDPRCERYRARDLLGAGLEPEVPMADLVFLPGGTWPHQYSSNSCCGKAIQQAVYIRQGVMGVPVPDRVAPSDRDIYYRGRAARVGWRNVVDLGANPVACWEVLRAPNPGGTGLGVVPYDELPFDLGKVDEPPPAGCYRIAADHGWLQYYWVLGNGEDRAAELDPLLRSGHPVTAAIAANEAMTRWDPASGPWRLQGARTGGHYICLVHVDAEGNYWAIGSYGRTFGVGGLHCIARDEILSSRTTYLATPVIDLAKLHALAQR